MFLYVSVLFLYVSVLWDFQYQGIQTYFTFCRKSIRRSFNIPYRTHFVLLPLICKDIPVKAQLHSRFLKFVLNNINCKNACVQLCMSICINGSQSAAGNSLNMLAFKYNFCINSLVFSAFNKLYTNIKSVFVTNERTRLCNSWEHN